MIMYAVDKNVPIPKIVRTIRIPVRRLYPFLRLEIDQSFFVPDPAKKRTLSTQASNMGRRHRRKFITRADWRKKGPDGWVQVPSTTKGAVPGVGVWRIK